ncbi:MAG: hypothetical protein PUE21_08310, partial [Lachnospiraceae bacterium]|nr:hypothetical protein [Lachnospiraceae bacterium]
RNLVVTGTNLREKQNLNGSFFVIMLVTVSPLRRFYNPRGYNRHNLVVTGTKFRKKQNLSGSFFVIMLVTVSPLRRFYNPRGYNRRNLVVTGTSLHKKHNPLQKFGEVSYCIEKEFEEFPFA